LLGVKPSDLSGVQSNKFELVNESLLARADEVIE